MLIKTPDLIEAMIELACSRRWLQTTIYVIEFSQHVLQGLWLKDSSLRQVHLSVRPQLVSFLFLFLFYF